MKKSWEKKWVRICLFGCFALLLIGFSLSVTAEETAIAPQGSWTTKTNGAMGQQQKISMASENYGWLVLLDASSTAYLVQYNGSSWSPVTSVGHSQVIVGVDIKMISANDGWLVLGGENSITNATSSIYHWDGTNWNFVTQLTEANGISLFSLDVLSANNIWALGDGNFWSSLYHWDGSNWSYVSKTPGGVWAGHDLAMLSDNDGWGVGFTGHIAHWDGSAWTAVPSSTSTNLNAIDMVDSNTGWAVGDDGTILAWDGTVWTAYSSPTSADLYAIDMVSANEGWIAGTNVMLYWDGSQWSTYTPPVSDTFHDIDMMSAKDGWMAGNKSISQYDVVEPELLMHYTSGAPSSYFSVAGHNFPANSTATITVNGQTMGTTPVNGNGSFFFILTTANADEGTYFVTASVNPTATKQFTLSAADPVRPQEDSGDIFDVPAGIAFNEFLYLPTLLK